MKTTKIILLILVALLIGNCTTQLPAVSGDTATTVPQATYTLAPNIEPSKTASPTNTPTLTPTITWTPLPTLSAQEANAKIKELLETNGGCELPCWWGITPYETTWPKALHFLSPFITRLGQGGSDTFYENSTKHFVTNYGVDYEVAGASEPGHIDFSIQDDLVIGVSVYPPNIQDNYQLHQVLALLGIPGQIYISARSSPEAPALDEVPPAILVLDYSQIGVWAAYGYLPDRVGEIISICPQDFGKRTSIFEELRGNIGGRLILFDPTMEYPRAVSIEEYADKVSGYRSASKLEDISNMTTDIFYNTFIDPNSKACLETPADLWP